MRESESLPRFKKHLMQQAGLALSQLKKYLLWVFLAKNEHDLEVSDFS